MARPPKWLYRAILTGGLDVRPDRPDHHSASLSANAGAFRQLFHQAQEFPRRRLLQRLQQGGRVLLRLPPGRSHTAQARLELRDLRHHLTAFTALHLPVRACPVDATQADTVHIAAEARLPFLAARLELQDAVLAKRGLQIRQLRQRHGMVEHAATLQLNAALLAFQLQHQLCILAHLRTAGLLAHQALVLVAGDLVIGYAVVGGLVTAHVDGLHLPVPVGLQIDLGTRHDTVQLDDEVFDSQAQLDTHVDAADQHRGGNLLEIDGKQALEDSDEVLTVTGLHLIRVKHQLHRRTLVRIVRHDVEARHRAAGQLRIEGLLEEGALRAALAQLAVTAQLLGTLQDGCKFVRRQLNVQHKLVDGHGTDEGRSHVMCAYISRLFLKLADGLTILAGVTGVDGITFGIGLIGTIHLNIINITHMALTIITVLIYHWLGGLGHCQIFQKIRLVQYV